MKYVKAELLKSREATPTFAAFCVLMPEFTERSPAHRGSITREVCSVGSVDRPAVAECLEAQLASLDDSGGALTVGRLVGLGRTH